MAPLRLRRHGSGRIRQHPRHARSPPLPLRQPAHAEAATQALAARFATRPLAEWLAVLGDLGAAVAPVNQGAQIARDPQIIARGALVEVAGRQVPANPIHLSSPSGETTATDRTPPTTIGADTDAVLKTAGFTADEIATLRTKKVI